MMKCPHPSHGCDCNQCRNHGANSTGHAGPRFDENLHDCFVERLRTIHANGQCHGGSNNEYGNPRAHSTVCQLLVEENG